MCRLWWIDEKKKALDGLKCLDTITKRVIVEVFIVCNDICYNVEELLGYPLVVNIKVDATRYW